ncbi:class II aldolase/adducin family protein [Pseudooceanicola sp. CBS1P-1]|uniref:Class II aldolase/adducin family protein n=1 Tax=Pseudooceanicola albus TaxID=2692189 RepID=A0A6L7GAM3_9RHOB|nr:MULTISPECIES: class II aldolase/adducin family protein [Pseudooceanicola]MBT9386301.1 class II aldolase/adducin family protein [Pseudooceanicola endophyticus]MXN20350.1 class II aldolase/adducin family protein [Pseudooceanicola albus]
MFDAQEDVRQDLAAVYRLIARFGMDDMIHTHVSARLPDEPDLLLINRYGDLFREVTPESLVVIDHDGHQARGAPVPVNTAGAVIHCCIHQARPDAACVVHTHTAAGVAVSCLAEGLLPLNQTALLFYDRIGYHTFEGIALDTAEQSRLVADLGDNRAMILRNHGLLTVGRTIGEAFSLMYNLEMACRMQLMAQGTGQTLHLPSADVCRRTAAQYDADPDGSADLEWQAMRRLAWLDA